MSSPSRGRSTPRSVGAPAAGGRGSPALIAGAGFAAALALRALLARAILHRLRKAVAALNEGDYRPVLASFASDAVLRFNEGTHRWAGEHHGTAEIERFLQNFVAAGIEGEIVEVAFAGPPWRMSLIARFDDHAADPLGVEIYRNRTVLWARMRWGRIIWQGDFYEDSERIGRFDARLSELGIAPVGARR
jgi:ketosteroid isomerase-like protein